MSWTLRNKAENGNGGSGTTLAVTLSGTSVVAGDVVVIAVADGTTIDISSVAESGGGGSASTWVPLTTNTAHTTNRTKFFYTLSSQKTGLVTYTATYASAASAREIHVWVFSASAAATFDTERHDGTAVASTAMDTGVITTTGTDEVVVCFCYHGSAATLSSEEVNGVNAVDQLDPGGNASSYYTTHSGTFTDNGTATESVITSQSNIIIALNIAGASTVALEWKQPTSQPTDHYNSGIIIAQSQTPMPPPWLPTVPTFVTGTYDWILPTVDIDWING